MMNDKRPFDRRAGRTAASARFCRALKTTLAVGALWALPTMSVEAFELPKEELRCKTIPEAIELLRSSGVKVAYSDGLVSQRMLVRQTPSKNEPAELLAEIVQSYGLSVRDQGGTLGIVPKEEGSLRRLRRITSPLLAREDSYDALPEWRGRVDMGTSVIELEFLEGSSAVDLTTLNDEVDFIVWRLPEQLAQPQRAGFELKQRIVESTSRARAARTGLEGSQEVIESLMDAELAPYVDGYLFSQKPWVPSLDPTGRPWWRTQLGNSRLLDRLLESTALGAAVVLLPDAEPGSSERALLAAIRATGAGLLERQPKARNLNDTETEVFTRTFLDPRTGNYQVAIYANDGGTRFSLELEPELAARVIFPAGVAVASESYGKYVDLQLEGPDPHWLIELEKRRDLPRHGETLVEDQVIVDAYEVVVRNQIFQKAEADKVLSLDVLEYATTTPMWRGGRRSLWEHRIFQRRDRLDEYLHLKVYRDGVPLPRDKMYKSILGRPIERIELAPLTVENRKTYRYRYLGSDEIDGHLTWKIAFDPVVPGRLVSGVIWIDQVTGAHRQIRAQHHNLGVGILSGDYTTHYRWIPGPGGCFWDWDHRYGAETYDYLDFEGASQIDYVRKDFRYNRTDLDSEIKAAHQSDVLIHVATPPNGHRWLVRGQGQKQKRGDVAYGGGWLRESDTSPEPSTSEPEPPTEGNTGEKTAAEESRQTSLTLAASQDTPANRGDGDVMNEMLAGPWAFPSRSRISVGYFGGSGSIEPNVDLGFNYLDFDFLRRGKRGKDPLYLWIGGFGEDGLVSLTDPHLFGSQWSLTTSLDLQFDPEEDFLFRQSTPTPGDESTIKNLSLESETRSVRLSLGRPLSGAVLMRLKLGLHAFDFGRKGDTDPTFVLPTNTSETTLRAELSYSHRSASVNFGFETGHREDWQPWGLGGRQEALDDWSRYDIRLSSARPFGRSQTLTGSLGLFGGSDLDRFSRRRLFEVDARVPGYSSSIGFDEGAHASLSYNFRIWKLPLRLRTDFAELRYENRASEPELVDQTLLGTQLNLNLHGPWRTDLLFGVGRGLYAEPARKELTSYWFIVSRRIGTN